MITKEKEGAFLILTFFIVSIVFVSFSLQSIIIDDNTLYANVESAVPTETPKALSNSEYVEVIRNNNPVVRLESIGKKTILPAKSCVPDYKIKDYGGLSAYESRLSKVAKCETGYMDGTVLRVKIANANSSISTINELISFLVATLDNLNKKGTIDGITFIGIPSGSEIRTEIENADKLSIKCLLNNDVKENDKVVGNYRPVNDNLYVAVTQEQKNVLKNIKSSIKDLSEKIQDASAIDMKTGKDNLSSLTNVLLSQALSIMNKFKKDFIPIDTSILSKSFLTDNENIFITIDLIKDKDGKIIIDNPGKAVSTIINVVTSVMPGIPTIKGPYYKSKINIKVGDESIENDKMVVPEPIIYSEVIDNIKKKITSLTESRSKFEKNLKFYKDALKKLESADYYCS